MATVPTKNASPSESYNDLRYNSGVLDGFLNSDADTVKDRFGKEKPTLKTISVNAPTAQQVEQARLSAEQSRDSAQQYSQDAEESSSNAALSSSSSSSSAASAQQSSESAASSASAAQQSASDAATSAANAASPNGVTDGSSAAAGKIGQVITGSSGPVAITTATVVNAASITLTPGDWEVNGVLSIAPSGGATAMVQASINNQSLTFAGFPNRVMRGGSSTYATELLCRRRYNVTTNTTVYLTGYTEFSAGTATVSGYLEARRTR